MYPCFYWQPVQLHKYWGDMVELLGMCDEPRCTMLYHLKVFQNIFGMPKRILLLLSNFDVTDALIRVDAASSVKY